MSKIKKPTAIIETPFKSTNIVLRNENLLYTNLVSRVLLKQGTSTLFFHTLYTQHLDDDSAEERNLGLEMSFMHHSHVDKKVVAIDRGISTGMGLGIKDAMKKGTPVEYFSLDPDLNAKLRGLSYEEVIELLATIEPNELGDLSNYRTIHLAEIETIKKIIMTFFAPLTDYCS